MKVVFNFLGLALLLSSCSKVMEGDGPYTITGRLLDNCENQEPVANQELYFLVDWDSAEEDRIATTDANGNFSYTFDGPPNNESVIGGSIRITDEKVVLCGIPNSSFEKDMDAGTVYVNPPQRVPVAFRISGDGYTDKDTVVISLTFHTDLRKISKFRIPGPFDNEVEVVREWTKYASSGVQTMPDFRQTTKPYVRRLFGTFGTACNWQLVSDGELGKVNYETLLLDVCENEAIINIDLGSKNSK